MALVYSKKECDTKKTAPKGGKAYLFIRQIISLKTWKSTISWHISFILFATILTVHAGWFVTTYKDHKQIEVNQLTKEVQASLTTFLYQTKSGHTHDITTGDHKEALLASTVMKGFTLYTDDFTPVKSVGNVPQLTIKGEKDISKQWDSDDGKLYERVLTPQDHKSPYYVVVRMDISSVKAAMQDHVNETVLVALILSGFVTCVLMLILGQGYFDPILRLQQNLQSAAKNPENPDLQDISYHRHDEIGALVKAAHSLVKENSNNLRRLRKTAEDKIHRLAYYDSLTMLPNRTYFVEKLKEMAESSNNGQTKYFGVLTLDIDHFKDINDTVGHAVGDELLKAVGARIQSMLPDGALLSRSGEDEFAVTIPVKDNSNIAVEFAEKLMSAIRVEPFTIMKQNFSVGISVGIAQYPDDAQTPDQVLKNADIALNSAKEQGRGIIVKYDPSFNESIQQRFQLLHDLREALISDELTLFYQPQFCLNSGQMIGAEALIRWFKKDENADGGVRFISPGDFIPIAEQSGLMVPMGEWILRTACKQAAHWQEHNKTPLRVAVNISAAQFQEPNFVEFVKDTLEEFNLPPELIEMEVTESAFMEDIDNTIAILNELHELGLEIAIDDFGTGYSSLAYLQKFPVDRLKIDQSFVRDFDTDESDAAIVKTVIALGQSLNMKVIAEGVETYEQQEILKNLSCDEVQGFRYARPMKPSDVDEFVAGYDGTLESFDK